MSLEKSLGLIESDWNLKKSIDQLKGYGLRGLIESDWNLKVILLSWRLPSMSGLIESDWNLKFTKLNTSHNQGSRINRIRLEFKDDGTTPSSGCLLED